MSLKQIHEHLIPHLFAILLDLPNGRRIYFDVLIGYLPGNGVAPVLIACEVIDLVESFERSEADGTHGACSLVVHDGIRVILPIATDVASQQLAVIPVPGLPV